MTSTPSDGAPSETSSFESWNRKLRMVTGLGLRSDAERQEWLQRRCLGWRDELVETSPMVRYLLQHISVLPIPAATQGPSSSSTDRARTGTGRSLPIPINCGICAPIRSAGLFSPTETDPDSPTGGQIKLCADSLGSKGHLEDVLAHELVHAYDHRRFQVDWSNLLHIACTEIRANALSGDCNWTREVDRHVFTFAKQRQACARRRAILSVAQHISGNSPAGSTIDQSAGSKHSPTPAEVAEKVVDQAWNSCWNDTRPFDEIY